EASKAACVAAGAPLETFSVESPGVESRGVEFRADWRAADLRPTVEGTRFRVFHHGEFFAELSLRLPGVHNVANALAATAVASFAGASATSIREALRDFPGICRRF